LHRPARAKCPFILPVADAGANVTTLAHSMPIRPCSRAFLGEFSMSFRMHSCGSGLMLPAVNKGIEIALEVEYCWRLIHPAKCAVRLFVSIGASTLPHTSGQNQTEDFRRGSSPTQSFVDIFQIESAKL
jgi:hypothetical protein